HARNVLRSRPCARRCPAPPCGRPGPGGIQAMADVHDYIDENLPRFREELFEFLRIPSVSARSEHREDMRAAAEWRYEKMRAVGLEAMIEETPGHPIVVGEWRGAGDDAPTVLVYGHYDVQPAAPLELWTSAPFEPAAPARRIPAPASAAAAGQRSRPVR